MKQARSENTAKVNTDKSQPFFARYLEEPKFLKVKTNVKAGTTAVVLPPPIPHLTAPVTVDYGDS